MARLTVTPRGINTRARLGATVAKFPTLYAPAPTGVVATDTANLNALIDAANSANALIALGRGAYSAIGPLHQIGNSAGLGCRGLIGSGSGTNNQTSIIFNVDGVDRGDCIIAYGSSKRFTDVFLDNQAVTATGATLHVQNCAYGEFSNVYARADGASSTAIMLEQVYAGSAFDAFMLVHLGCWYNTFQNVTAIYGANGSTGGNVGDGLVFTVNANAISVVNPPGQPAGTYSGDVNHNDVFVVDIEGKARGVFLNYASRNHFVGGQFIGCANQVSGRNVSSKNTFMGLHHAQWGTNAFDLDGTCTSNVFLSPTMFTLAGPPYTLGNAGGQPYVLASQEYGAFGVQLSDALIQRAALNRVQVGAVTEVGDIQSGWAGLKYAGLGTNNAAIQQNVNGTTFLGAPTGQRVGLRVNAAEKLSVTDATATVIFTGATTGTASPAAGGAGALPATPAGYMTVAINGTNRNIPYY